jgi:ABC-type protease/lipase transport system fused ATPase/permease subunit
MKHGAMYHTYDIVLLLLYFDTLFLFLLCIGLIGLCAANVFVVIFSICLALRHNLVEADHFEILFQNQSPPIH